MIRNFVLAVAAVYGLAACASHCSNPGRNQAYQPRCRPEKIEFCQDRLDVYPDDVRAHLTNYTNLSIVWAGIICSNDIRDSDNGNKVIAETRFEQHYFDWVQNGSGKDATLAISPRGEGFFTAHWMMDKTSGDATFENGERFAKKGRLAIFYGVPTGVESNGDVRMKYRYLRVIDRDHYFTNEYDYGRLGESFQVIGSKCCAIKK